MEYEFQPLLELAKNIAHSANISLQKEQKKSFKKYEYLPDLPCEMKAEVDLILEEKILNQLSPIGLPIVSEESGELSGDEKSGLRFIVDPLDGTVNFVRNLGQVSISIALYKNNTPIFGVLSIYPSGDLAWGGREIGSFLNGKRMSVSDISNKTRSVLCTGIPSRLNIRKPKEAFEFANKVSEFGKVRMLGSASISLLQVAKGSAEIYIEQDIMMWDVAAGLALVEGSGGFVSIKPGRAEGSLVVLASNGVI